MSEIKIVSVLTTNHKERTFKTLGTTTVMMYSITLCRILYSFKDYDRLLGDASLLYNPNLLE
jgi:hypothetical protein